MIVEFNLIDVISFVATILSLAGNWYVANTDLKIQTRGYWIWFVSNFIWIIYFMGMQQLAPLTLFTAYFVITLIALARRVPDDWGVLDTTGEHY